MFDKEKEYVSEGEARLVNEEQMFKWLQLAHNHKIKIQIYEARPRLDMS